MQLDEDQTSDSDKPADKPDIKPKEDIPTGLNPINDCPSYYSTRKRRAAPRRYSPSPCWERWESWKDCAALSRKQNFLVMTSRPPPLDDQMQVKHCSPAPSSCNDAPNSADTIESSAENEKQTNKRPHSPAPIARKKLNSSKNPTQRNKKSDAKNTSKDKQNPSEGEIRVYGIRKRRSAPKRFSPTHFSDRKLLFSFGELDFKSSQRKSCSPSPRKIRSPSTRKSRSPSTRKSRSPSTEERKSLITKNNTSPNMKKGRSSRTKKSKSPSTRKRSLTKKSKSPSTRKRSLTKKSKSPSTRKRSLTKKSKSPSTRKRSLTKKSGSPILRKKDPISEKWADVLRKNPIVLLERYVPHYVPPSPPPPSDNDNNSNNGEDSESVCCTPTPSWMDDEEMAAYYNTESALNIGRSPSALSFDESVTSGRSGIEGGSNSYLRSSLSNGEDTDSDDEQDDEKCSPSLLENNSESAGCFTDTTERVTPSFGRGPNLSSSDISSEKTNKLGQVSSVDEVPVDKTEKKTFITGGLAELVDRAANGKTEKIGSRSISPLEKIDGILTVKNGPGTTKCVATAALDDFAPLLIENKKLASVTSSDNAAVEATEKEGADSTKCVPLKSMDDLAVTKNGTVATNCVPILSMVDHKHTKKGTNATNHAPIPSTDDNAVKKTGTDTTNCVSMASTDSHAVIKIGTDAKNCVLIASIEEHAVRKNGTDATICAPVESIDDRALKKNGSDVTNGVSVASMDDLAVTKNGTDATKFVQTAVMYDRGCLKNGTEATDCVPIASIDDPAVMKNGTEATNCVPIALIDDKGGLKDGTEATNVVSVASIDDHAVTKEGTDSTKSIQIASMDDIAVKKNETDATKPVQTASMDDPAVMSNGTEATNCVPIALIDDQEGLKNGTEATNCVSVASMDDNAVTKEGTDSTKSIQTASMDDPVVMKNDATNCVPIASVNDHADMKDGIDATICPMPLMDNHAVKMNGIDATERVLTASEDDLVGTSVVKDKLGPVLSTNDSTTNTTEGSDSHPTNGVPTASMDDLSEGPGSLIHKTDIGAVEENGSSETNCAPIFPAFDSSQNSGLGPVSADGTNSYNKTESNKVGPAAFILTTEDKGCQTSPPTQFPDTDDTTVKREPFVPVYTRPVTRRSRLNSEVEAHKSPSKSKVRSTNSKASGSLLNKSFPVRRDRLHSKRYSPIPVLNHIKKEPSVSPKESLILIRRDYVSASHKPTFSETPFTSFPSFNNRRGWSPTNVEDRTTKNVSEAFSEPKKETSTSLSLNEDRDSWTDIGSRCASSLSDVSTTSARAAGPASHLSINDVFEIVCGAESYSPTLFRHDVLNRSPLPVNVVSPQPRNRPHSPAVSLPERSSPSCSKSTRTLKRRSVSNNLDERFRRPERTVSSLSLNGFGSKPKHSTRKKVMPPKRYRSTSSCYDETTNSSVENSFYFDSEKKPYATRSSRSAPKRYSPTPFFDAYYHYTHKDLYTKSRSSGDTENKQENGNNKQENGNNRRVRRMSVKSVSNDSLKGDDDTHWEKFHGSSCTKQCASLKIIKDTPVPRDIDDKFRAQKTAPPEVFVADSKIPDAGNGAWASEPISAWTRFGPYEGRIVPAKVFTSYAWLIRKNGKPDRCVDATEPGLSNWMRFVNCARHDGEQNLEAFQCHGNIYYKTTRHVNPHEELLVWYGNDYGRQLGIDPKVCDEEDEQSWRENNFKCPACPFAFASPLYLQNHKRVCRSLKSGAGPSKESKNNFRIRKVIGHEKSRKTLSQSDPPKRNKNSVRSYPGPMQLESYAASNKRRCNTPSSEDRYFCGSCNIGFRHKYHMERHLVTKKHGANEPYTCRQCNKSFSVKSSLTRHSKVHTGEKPYPCPICDRRFSEKSNLKKHFENHVRNKRFPCSKCKMTFSEKGSLTKHHYRKHNNKRHQFVCKTCKRQYCEKQSLRRHERIHNGEKPFACYVCNKRFSRRELLKTHLKIHRIGAN